MLSLIHGVVLTGSLLDLGDDDAGPELPGGFGEH
jgi:hypothetical protein